MNSTRVSAARERGLSEADDALLRMDAATKSNPTSAPETPATATPKFTQLQTT
jgi:hypothetical protein